MSNLTSSLRKLPPSTVIKILRKVFSLPAPAARLILNDVTKARKSHKSWIYKVKKGQQDDWWSGCWIGENVHGLKYEDLLERIDNADLILFYVHGGGFRVGSCTMYMETNIAWINVLKEKYGLTCMIMSIDYRLAPEYQYPSPVEDVVRAYEHLVQLVNSSKTIVVGDSAGAALALSMLFITHDPSMFEIQVDQDDTPVILNELPRPAGVILISPLVTDETTSESWKTNIKYDYITHYTAKVIKRDYFQSPTKQQEDEVNQVLGIAELTTGFAAFLSSHVLMYIGNLEVLRDDALNLAKKAEQDGVYWQTVMVDEVHDWFCVREVVKDKNVIKRADETFADFCYRALGGSSYNKACVPTTQQRDSVATSVGVLEVVKEEEEDFYTTSDNNTTTASSYSELRLSSSKLSLEEKDYLNDGDDDGTRPK